MVKTALYDKHIESNGKIVDFYGFDMPLQYNTGIINEHLQVRKEAGVFDVSHMGDLLIHDKSGGKDIQHLLTNKILDIDNGKCVYSHLTDDNGIIIDDLIVTKITKDEYLIVPNASMTGDVRNWIQKNTNTDVKDLSSDLSCLAVQGPRSADVLSILLGLEIEKMKRFTASGYDFRSGTFIGIDEIDMLKSQSNNGLISRTGYTGEKGYEIIIHNANAGSLWGRLLEFEPIKTLPIGLGARDTLRLEMGYLLSGQDFARDRTPLETNCAWVVKWDHDFIGKDALLDQKSGNYQKLIGFKVLGKASARPGSAVSLSDSPHETVGSVSSGNHSPTLGIPIGMAYIDKEHSKPDAPINLEYRNRTLSGLTAKMPLVTKP